MILKLKELQDVCTPIMTKLYQEGMSGGQASGMPGGMPVECQVWNLHKMSEFNGTSAKRRGYS